MPIVANPPKPVPPPPSPQATLAVALARFITTSSCPAYLRSAAQAWLPTV